MGGVMQLLGRKGGIVTDLGCFKAILWHFARILMAGLAEMNYARSGENITEMGK